MRRILATALVTVTLFAATTTASFAATQPGITVTKGQTTEAEYGPIPGNMPAAPDVNWTPSGCDTAAPGGAQCDRIPVKIPIPPDIDAADDYYVEIAISWDDPEGLNDLDIYFWDNQQLQRDNGVEP